MTGQGPREHLTQSASELSCDGQPISSSQCQHDTDNSIGSAPETDEPAEVTDDELTAPSGSQEQRERTEKQIASGSPRTYEQIAPFIRELFSTVEDDRSIVTLNQNIRLLLSSSTSVLVVIAIVAKVVLICNQTSHEHSSDILRTPTQCDACSQAVGQLQTGHTPTPPLVAVVHKLSYSYSKLPENDLVTIKWVALNRIAHALVSLGVLGLWLRFVIKLRNLESPKLVPMEKFDTKNRRRRGREHLLIGRLAPLLAWLLATGLSIALLCGAFGDLVYSMEHALNWTLMDLDDVFASGKFDQFMLAAFGLRVAGTSFVLSCTFMLYRFCRQTLALERNNFGDSANMEGDIKRTEFATKASEALGTLWKGIFS